MLVGEALQDGSAHRNFNEMKDGQGEQDEDDVRKPGIKSSEVKALRHPVGVEELKDVEVEEVEAVAALTNKEQGAPGKERGDGMRTAEAENQGGEEWGKEAAVHKEVGGVAYEKVEEEPDGGKAD
jgi:hypothetical protein